MLISGYARKMKTQIYPSILKRYLASFLDGLIIFAMFFAIAYLFQGNSDFSRNIRIVFVLIMFLVYEPFCTSRYCTIGQKMTGIRIRSYTDNNKRISLPKAYIRIVTKVFLGFLSLITIIFSENRRAIHDFVANSIVLEEKSA